MTDTPRRTEIPKSSLFNTVSPQPDRGSTPSSHARSLCVAESKTSSRAFRLTSSRLIPLLVAFSSMISFRDLKSSGFALTVSMNSVESDL